MKLLLPALLVFSLVTQAQNRARKPSNSNSDPFRVGQAFGIFTYRQALLEWARDNNVSISIDSIDALYYRKYVNRLDIGSRADSTKGQQRKD